MKNMVKFLGLLMIPVLFLVGCGSNQTTDTKETSSSTSKETTVLTVTNGRGEKVEVPNNPQKVVVFDMGSLDTMKELGMSDRVIATPLKTLPAYLDDFSGVENAGGIKEPDMEKINALQPDLIIISGRQEDFAADLEKIAPTLYLGVDSTKPWESAKQNMTTLGTIFAKEEAAKDSIAGLEKQIADLKTMAQESGKKGLVSLVNEGSLSAFGEGSRFGIVYDTFGVTPVDPNIEVSPHGKEVSYEYVLEQNPDILFVVDRTKAIGGDNSKNNVAENELVKQTTAGKEGKVVSLTPDVWYLSGGGIKSTELMIQDVGQAFK